jgi:hypothetical protein
MGLASISRTFQIVLIIAVAALIMSPAEARHRRWHKGPLTQRVEEPLTPRAVRQHRAKPKHRPSSRQAQQPAPDTTKSPADLPVPQTRPSVEPEAPALPAAQAQKSGVSKPEAALDRFNQEKSHQEKQPRPERSQDAGNEPGAPAAVPIPTPRPDTTEPDIAQPDVAQPDVARPDAPQPVAKQPETTQPDSSRPEAVAPAVIPLPQKRPAQPEVEPADEAQGKPRLPAPPESASPEPVPAEAEPPAEPQQKPADAGDKKMLPDPRSADLPDAQMPAEEIACRQRLKTLGVAFEEHKAESNLEIGCSIPYPITIKSLGTSIAILQATELNCQMAEAAARFAADVVQPAAKAEFGVEVKSIDQASAYVCRPRHGTRKLSEHAFGNALDIASFTLSDGKKIEIGPSPPEGDARFLDKLRKAACGPFKTVLGPGADADHSLHFHLDLEPRKHGGTFCQ